MKSAVHSNGEAEGVGALRARHLDVARRSLTVEGDCSSVMVDDSESPLAWLARRRGRDGRPMIAAQQFQAGERLRADFTVAHLMPRTTSNWVNPLPGRRGAGNGGGHFTDVMIASRQRVRAALEAAGPEFSGLLLDVCCFLKGLEDVERERRWPSRSAKVVLQLGLDRLARHYGLEQQARGPDRGAVRTWLAPGETFSVNGKV